MAVLLMIRGNLPAQREKSAHPSQSIYHGIKTAIASTSKNSHTVLEHLGLIPLFDGIADGWCVVNGKPAPDIFVHAAGMVGVHTPDCLGIEDAAAGVEAIK